MPFFSIIIPTYNRAHLISGAIESVLKQTFPDWELIIVDDGSTDNTKEVVDQFSDNRIRYIYQENAERSAARNNGIQNALGEWICFLDSDDIYLENHLTNFHTTINKTKNEYKFIVSAVYHEIEGVYEQLPIYEGGELPARFILRNTTLTPISVCINKSCFKEHNFLDKYKKAYWEDTHLWLRLALEFSFLQINEPTSVIKEHMRRSIKEKLSIVRIDDHIAMIKDLFQNHSLLMKQAFEKKDWISYIDRKYRMFLYTTRQNKQLGVSLQVWTKAMLHQPSFYLISEFPKIFLNQLNIGIHER